MSWYYAENGKQIGPVGDDEWATLTGSGKITAETLVWQDGMASWQPWRMLGSTPSGGSSLVSSGTAVCSLCQKVLPADEVISMGGRLVCGSCKPLAVQMVKEGVSIPGDMVYGGFWIRVGAKLIDTIILIVVNMIVGGIVGLVIGVAFRGSAESTIAALAGAVVGLLVQAGYSIYFNGKMGATPGKMACGLKVIRSDGSPLTIGRATGRFFAEMLSSLTMGIGYLIVAFDEEKRGLHDRVADTRVVKK